ncbi:hypothetical protein C8R47DRAFT_1215130 [Mycena vitilis]|nr:hypothetical protein C8R47DRAFT_1215130 [Mycena vitilis]
MGEAVFQAMWEVFIAVEPQVIPFGRDPPDDAGLAYTNNISPQLGLLNSKIVKDAYYHWKGDLLRAGLDRFGYLDVFLCAFQNLHPGVAIAIEFKYLNLHGIFRAKYDTEEQCHRAVHGPPGEPSTFKKKCEEKMKEINEMSEVELREVVYHFYSYSGPGSAPNEQRIEFGRILDAGKTQLEQYMNAIVNGEAFDVADGSEPEGLTAADGRVQVSRTSTNSPDKLIGYLVCGIGSRIVHVQVVPKKQNTRYQWTKRTS